MKLTSGTSAPQPIIDNILGGEFGFLRLKSLIGFTAHIALESHAGKFKINIQIVDALSLALLSNADIFVEGDISQEHLNKYFGRNSKLSWNPVGKDKSWPPRVD